MMCTVRPLKQKSYSNATMGWFKQLYLSCIFFSGYLLASSPVSLIGVAWGQAAAACVSCQELTSTLREGNYTCPGEEVTFTCTIRGPSSLSGLTLAWSSAKYISRSLQLSTTDRLGAVSTSSINGTITATATVTNIANITGELILESTLRITAVVASTVTCMSSADGGTASIKFSMSAVPGVPQRISAAEIVQPRDDICIILVLWDPPANSDPSEIDQYIVYVPSQNISDISSSTISTLTVPNCGDDIRIQVAAVNRIGCVGMNSSEVPLDIPTAPATIEGGSASTSNQLGAGAVAGITIAVALVVIVCICVLSGVIIGYIYYHFKKNKTLGSHPQSDELKNFD